MTKTEELLLKSLEREETKRAIASMAIKTYIGPGYRPATPLQPFALPAGYPRVRGTDAMATARSKIREALDAEGTSLPKRDLRKVLEAALFGQTAALDAVVPAVRMWKTGMAPKDRPAGVFMLLGPTGTGKTRLVEALAAALHGNDKLLLRVDCGEFQKGHEIAKLIGAPPGYLGHRETQPLLTASKLSYLRTTKCNLALILFDEIEKASDDLQRLLLGILDKGRLTLGDNTSVYFEDTMIFMTSNIGVKELTNLLSPTLGFDVREKPVVDEAKLAATGKAAVKKRFSAEFINRLDAIVTFRPLDATAFSSILEAQIVALQELLCERLGPKAPTLQVTNAAAAWLLREGFSAEYGARELKRVLLKHIQQPLAVLIDDGEVGPEDSVAIDVTDGKLTLTCAS